MDGLQAGTRITIMAVRWDSDAEKFVHREVIGTVDEYGVIQLEHRTMDCYSVPVAKLGAMYRRSESGNDYDVVFCRNTNTDLRNAMKVWEHYIADRVMELEEDLRTQKNYLRKIKLLQFSGEKSW